MRQMIGYGMSALIMVIVVYAFAPRSPTPMPATKLNADRVQVNDLLREGTQFVAVGERGTILLSSDSALSWQLAKLSHPRPSTLTGVLALGSGTLVAVGHDSWILRSTDEGQSWQQVHLDEETGEPLLGVWSADGAHVVAFGSYGKYLESADGGISWTAREVPADGYHLNGMDGGRDGRQMLVGEQGLVLRSVDSGQTWDNLEPFYNGSLFGVARLSVDRWVAYGMRGHVFVSEDFGQSWQQVELDHNHSLYGHVLLPDSGGLVLVGADSTLVRLDAMGRLLGSSQREGLGTLTSAAALSERVVLVGGARGVYQGASSSLAVVAQ